MDGGIGAGDNKYSCTYCVHFLSSLNSSSFYSIVNTLKLITLAVISSKFLLFIIIHLYFDLYTHSQQFVF